MEKITGGLSNEVFKYKNLIFKFYSYSPLNLDYNFEEIVQKQLFKEYANVPEITQSIIVDGKLTGRIEKYIESKTISKEQFISSIPICAKILRQIHSVDISQLTHCPNFFVYLNNWVQLANVEMCNLKNLKLFPHFSQIQKKAPDYISQLVKFAQQMKFNLTLTHNDFQQLNLLVDNNGSHYVIDFEYACLNYIYYDIANYFAECGFDNTELKYDKSKYPNKETRCEFYKCYFQEAYSDEYYGQIDFIVSNFMPVVEYFWYIWSVLKYTFTESPDYVKYANIRAENFLNLINSPSPTN